MKRLGLSIIVLFAVKVAAHSDTVLEMQELGYLTGLPGEYSPARFHVESWVLEVRANKYVFPDCFKEALSSISLDSTDLIFSASWYHENSPLPPYLAIQDEDRKIHLLFALDTLLPLDWLNFDYSKQQGGKFKILAREELCKAVQESP